MLWALLGSSDEREWAWTPSETDLCVTGGGSLGCEPVHA